MAYTFDSPQRSAAAVHALLAANRLEARPRSPEFNRALRAEIRDPAWLLARQWQMREFRAEDRGTPASVKATVRTLPLTRLALPGQPARAYDPITQPLEAAVEAQPRAIGPGLRLQMGQYWLRQLRTLPGFGTLGPADQALVLGLFAQVPALALPAPAAATDPVAFAQQSTLTEAQQLLALAGPTAFDGYELYKALLLPFAAALGPALADSAALEEALNTKSLVQALAADPRFAAQVANLQKLARAPGIAAGAVEEAARQFVLASHRLYLLGEFSTSWSTEDLAYSFAVGTAGPAGLGTTHYPGGGALPWYAVDQADAPGGTPALSTAPRVTRQLLPTEVQFPGAPAARWWEFEDRRVDFGQVTGDASDWGRMLLQEFMFLYQNDWFSVPYSVPVGSVSAVESVQVTDVFGRTYRVQPAGAGQRTENNDGTTYIDNDHNRWRLFGQTDAAHAGPAPAPQLYVPATALAPLVGRPSEQVSFRREEATNLVWAVESIVPDGFAGGLDGATAAAQTAQALRALVPAPAPALTAADGSAAPGYTYQLAGTVPENWLPFVPVVDAATGAAALEQGALARQGLGLAGADGLVQPRTALLQLRPGEPYRLREHEVPPAGVRVDGQCYRARWHDGRTVSWFGRQRGPAQPGGSSGLVFDQLKARRPA